MPSQSISGSSLLSSNNLPSLSSSVPKPSSSTLFPATPSSTGATVAAKHEVSQPRTSDPSTLNFTSTLPLSTHEGNLSSVSTSSSIMKAESLTSLSHPSVGMHGSKTEPVSQTETSVANMPFKTEKDVQIQTSASQAGLGISTSDLKIGPSLLSTPTELSTNSKPGSQVDLGGSSKSSAVVTSAIRSELPSATPALSPVSQSSEGIVGSVKNAVSDSSHEEEMDEAPEMDQATEFALGNLGGFGIGSTPALTTPKSNPFGVAAPNKNTTFGTSPYMMPAPGGELFRPASFSFQSPQPPAPSQPTNAVNFSGGFNSGSPGQVSAVSGFGQPAQIGAGQQALGSVLGTFGQSRQLGAGLPGSNVASAGSFGSGFAGISTGGFGGGFASASSGGGFASLATGGGGLAAAATVGGGFAPAVTTGGGFAASAGGGFAAAASAGGGFASAATAGTISGGGFGAFSNQQGSGGFSAFGGSSGIGRPPSELFTQMRK
ncbi:hypothetical protein CDL12_24570 [Handroanthus impetiginosus]|uniref:Uncharacterized protein n=1 Tax=Handroanthus impetiginosus TaxID=429701 RepID=A0A2G9GD49_9LAMI|nr:hypothetical protein CDL12_24570 [Handroanthus impetiginosus]